MEPTLVLVLEYVLILLLAPNVRTAIPRVALQAKTAKHVGYIFSTIGLACTDDNDHSVTFSCRSVCNQLLARISWRPFIIGIHLLFTAVDSCKCNNNCPSNSRCEDYSDRSGHDCICDECYTGAQCDLPINSCYCNNPCSQGQQCSMIGNQVKLKRVWLWNEKWWIY